MRKLFDSLIMCILKWCFNWLYHQYDILFDGIELWILDKLPDVPELEDFEKE